MIILSEGTEAEFAFSIDEAQMDAYARLSGDENPLHCDPAFAKDRGFQGRVVYGGLILAAISRMLGMQLPGRNGIWTGINLRFENSLYVGENAVVVARVKHSSAAAGALEIFLRVKTADRVIAVGTADTVVRTGNG